MKKVLVGMIVGLWLLTVATPYSFAQMCNPGGVPERAFHGDRMYMWSPMMHGGMKQAGHHHFWKLLAGLGLDDKQKDSLKALRSKTMKDVTKKMADKKIAGIELRDLLDKDPVDMKAVEASVKKSESLRTEILLAHIKAHEEMKSILTPDQRKKMKEMMEGGTGAGCGMMGGNAPQMPMHEHMH